jgi:hypothetical protein
MKSDKEIYYNRLRKIIEDNDFDAFHRCAIDVISSHHVDDIIDRRREEMLDYLQDSGTEVLLDGIEFFHCGSRKTMPLTKYRLLRERHLLNGDKKLFYAIIILLLCTGHPITLISGLTILGWFHYQSSKYLFYDPK